ncbi:MAG: hypothetical protein U5R31_00545 [Acidimicrobiia bacterium]|nr:hypothetical protein [Acidimicrobiia bacterium]
MAAGVEVDVAAPEGGEPVGVIGVGDLGAPAVDQAVDGKVERVASVGEQLAVAVEESLADVSRLIPVGERERGVAVARSMSLTASPISIRRTRTAS